ncbi:MAG: hypothetical protein KW804_01615 [Candidatus Doudnabacteria bacterium]|nr:hypothetical protein [Candidatus Doudnabacteria bacterium]
MNRYLTSQALKPAFFGGILGIAVFLLCAIVGSVFEASTAQDWSTWISCAFAVCVGLFFAESCASSLQSWGDDSTRSDVMFNIGILGGGAIVNLFFVYSWWQLLFIPFFAVLGFAGFCSTDERSIVDIFFKRRQASPRSNRNDGLV